MGENYGPVMISREPKTREDLAGGQNPDVFFQVKANQGIINEGQTVVIGRPNRIGELRRRSASPTLATVNGNEIGVDAGLYHGFTDTQHLTSLTDT